MVSAASIQLCCYNMKAALEDTDRNVHGCVPVNKPWFATSSEGKVKRKVAPLTPTRKLSWYFLVTEDFKASSF